MFLQNGDFAIEPAEDVHHLGKSAEVSLDIFGAGDFLEEDLGEASGGGLETDFGELGGIVSAEVIDEVILVEAVVDDEILLEAPFEVAAGGPIGDIAFGEGKAGLMNCGDDVFVWNAIPEHAVDHVAVEFRERGDTTTPAGMVLRGAGGEVRGINHSGSRVMAYGLKAEGGWRIE